jgi:hypothetical protein
MQIRRSRAQGLKSKPKKSFPAPSLATNSTRQTQPPSGETSCDIVLQPETRPISQEQLVAEVKGIYAGLVMVEAKCIEVDNKQATLAAADAYKPKLNNEQWQALIALHRTLLHEHHDFFLASQHPSASPALRRLASKYAMPARMWRHGIHSFLELLRHRLPASLDHMLAFIYLAYSMMALLYETVPAFEDTWIECLGDLGRYRMAIEDDDIRDREVWTSVARHWYSKAADKAPTTGRLYHHLAILARPNAIQQLFYYAKSLCVAIPFTSARQSILTLFDPVLNSDNGQFRLPLNIALVEAHGLLFTGRSMERSNQAVHEFIGLLDNEIERVSRNSMEQGYYIAVANIVAMLGFACKENLLMRAISPATMVEAFSNENSLSTIPFWKAQNLSNSTLEIGLQRIGDPNVLPFLHVTLVFLHCMSRHPNAMNRVQAEFYWKPLATMLNALLLSHGELHRVQAERGIRSPKKDDDRPFPEDFAMRGLSWTKSYYSSSWFTNEKISEDEKYHELASMTAQRKERNHWLTSRIGSVPRFVRSSFLGMLQKKTVRSMVLLNQVFKSFRITAAVPISAMTESQPKSDSEGFINYFAGQLHQLRDHLSGPMVENTGYACLLTGIYYGLTRCHEGSWEGANLLEIATTITSSYSYYFGNGEWLSDPQVAMVASLNFRLSVKILQQKLSRFPKTWMPTVFCIESASFGSAGMLAKYMPTPGGRYENPWVQAAMLLPLTNLFFTSSWIIFVRNSGLAKHLEEKDLCAAIVEFFQKWLLAVLALLLILVLLAKV